MPDKGSVIDSIRSQEAVSVCRLFLLLQAVRQQPTLFSAPEDSLAAALATQSSLAAFSYETLDIARCSLNTLKRSAQRDLSGGWQALDRARLKARDSLQAVSIEQSRPRRGTKAEAEGKLKVAEQKLEQARSDCWQLVGAVRRLLYDADSYAEQFDIPELSVQVKKNRADVLALFNFLHNPPPGAESGAS
ncbi:hypothetical protein OKW40_003677 [Paraburkholderia sp. RAU6.4a]|uniref:hypothetical protein n=1 Tax=Paraburkholderia sp. RAU6.4a TaxID=2991067 RepID=UPI003D19625B